MMKHDGQEEAGKSYQDTGLASCSTYPKSQGSLRTGDYTLQRGKQEVERLTTLFLGKRCELTV